MKKLIAFVTAALMATMVFTGCSSNELALYKNMNSMNAMKNYSCSGSITIKLNKLELNSSLPSSSSSSAPSSSSSAPSSSSSAPSSSSSALVSSPITSLPSSFLGNSPTDLKSIQQMFSNATISYTGSEDCKDNIVTLNMDVTFGNSTSTTVNCILNNANNKSLFDISPAAAAFIPSTFKYTDVTINSKEYYEYDLNSIISQLSASQSSSATDPTQVALNSSMISVLKNLTTVTKSTTLQQDMQKKAMSLSDNLMNKYFNKLTLGFVNKTANNTYSCHFTTDTAYTVLKNLITYIAKNPNTFKSSLVNFAKSLTDSEVASLNISTIKTKAQFVAAINNIPFSSLSAILPTLDSQLKPILSQIKLNCDYTLAKTSSSSYNVSESFSFDDTNMAKAPLFIDFSVSATGKVIGK